MVSVTVRSRECVSTSPAGMPGVRTSDVACVGDSCLMVSAPRPLARAVVLSGARKELTAASVPAGLLVGSFSFICHLVAGDSPLGCNLMWGLDRS